MFHNGVMPLQRLLRGAGCLFAMLLPAQTPTVCECDPAHAESMRQRQCSLCGEAEKQTGDVFILKDISPRKPGRWLALPRKHYSGQHHLHEMPATERIALWEAAIGIGRELFGEEGWGVAYNGSEVRTQCHTHIHIGRFAAAAENNRNVITVSRIADIPAPRDSGVWVHPYRGRMHVHLGEQITETVLVR